MSRNPAAPGSDCEFTGYFRDLLKAAACPVPDCCRCWSLSPWRRHDHRADELKWPRPVRPGDELRVEAEVLEVRRSSSRPGQGFVKCRTTTLNQNDEPVQVLVMNLLVQARSYRQGESASSASSNPVLVLVISTRPKRAKRIFASRQRLKATSRRATPLNLLRYSRIVAFAARTRRL